MERCDTIGNLNYLGQLSIGQLPWRQCLSAYHYCLSGQKYQVNFFILFAIFIVLVGLGFHRYFVIEDNGRLRIVSLNPFRKSSVAIAQIKKIEVNKSGIIIKIKNQPDRIFYMRKWPKKYFLDALAVHPDFFGEVELIDNFIKLDYFEVYKANEKAPTKS